MRLRLRTERDCNTLQHTATHCNSLQLTATHCSTLQYTATHRNTLQRTATHHNTLQHTATQGAFNTIALHASPELKDKFLPPLVSGEWTGCVFFFLFPFLFTTQHTATRCNTLQHAATRYNTLQHAAIRCNTHLASRLVSLLVYHFLCFFTATQGIKLQHTATFCSTLQHTATHCSTLQHTATHCNTLQHTATHCNTPHIQVLPVQHSQTYICKSYTHIHMQHVHTSWTHVYTCNAQRSQRVHHRH